MSRIEMTDTTMDVLVKMSDGNPGALTAMMEILEKHDAIDPQAAFGGLGAIMLLDTWEIYGTDIYILFSDICNRDIRKLLLLMRATQMGDFSHTKLQSLAADQTRQATIDDDEWKKLDDLVCEKLTEFAPAQQEV
ncbi:MAG: hypothetical protein JKY59_00030 [Emcibacter sp.]|nr:hypothetical protein [Emcibacter sp.]